MARKQDGSAHLHRARTILESASAGTLSREELVDRAVELAAAMLEEANRTQTFKERRQQAQLARMMQDPVGKVFTTAMTDECFRSKNSFRVASQIVYLLEKFGAPRYLSSIERMQLNLFRILGKPLAPISVAMVTWVLRKQTASVILPGEPEPLRRHMMKRRAEGVRLNLNHLGEAILGEEEAQRRLLVYLDDLKNPDIEYVSVKISTIFSQIHLLAWEESKVEIKERLRQLYRAAMQSRYRHPDGRESTKFVNLDMEEYRDLLLTKETFIELLSEPEFQSFSAGIVLQAYLPDSFEIQKELTEWAMGRVASRGAPIKIRIVKGANLAMEQFEASLHGWPQAPYTRKSDVDANYKRMVSYGCQKLRAQSVNLGIGSHNLFDIAYAMLLRAQEKIEEEVCFEMLEGMADHMRRVVQKLSGSMLLYCPVARREDFQSAIAYLIRRLDENTGAENFLRHTFGLKPNSSEWDEQVLLFRRSCQEMHSVSATSRRTQTRLLPPAQPPIDAPFQNEPNTDFSKPSAHAWLQSHIENWKRVRLPAVPNVIGGQERHQEQPEGVGYDPSTPGEPFYYYSLASWPEVEEALDVARDASAGWVGKAVIERCEIIARSAQKLREKRGDLIGAMMRDGGKTPVESDPEISEAIDFAEYYRHCMKEYATSREIHLKPKGTFLVTPPWNFPAAIPFGGMVAALLAGNSVLFKPAPEVVLVGWMMVNALWDAGVPKDVLQFINCVDDPVGSKLIADHRIDGVILTGATSTAELFLRLNPRLDLMAETGGKNAMIISAMSDHDLAIKDLVQSAFGHSGQKCSAASLAIIEAELYDDPHFMRQLKDAVESLHVGPATDLSSKVVPLIRAPGEALVRGLTHLDPGEHWLVEPHPSSHNPLLWSPGVKMGVREGSFMHQTELFGPVLGIMRAKNLDHAIHLANGTRYGLTSGLQSLDDRERKSWIRRIEAGNLYINRTITGAIVHRQPFGGAKASCFGHGAKAGGPNYLLQMMEESQGDLPREKSPVSQSINNLTTFLSKMSLPAESLGVWYASASSYAYWGKKLHEWSDPSLVVGQDNFFYLQPRKHLVIRVQEQDRILDLLRILAAALSASAQVEMSWCSATSPVQIDQERWHKLVPECRFVKESGEKFLKRVESGKIGRIRLASPPSDLLVLAAAKSGTYLCCDPVLATGRYELLHYLREVSLSIDYHRYGNLGLRESESRAPIA